MLPRCQRTAARLLGLGTIGLFALAVLGISWEPLGMLGTTGLLAPALWFACLPAAHAWVRIFGLVGKWLGGNLRAGAVVLVLGGIGTLVTWEKFTAFARPLLSAQVSGIQAGAGP